MTAELGASHAYVAPPDLPDEVAGQQGFLGADVAWDGGAGAWRVRRLLRGDTWDALGAAPLSAPAAGAAEGVLLRAINGTRLTREVPPEVALRRLAGREVFVSLGDEEQPGSSEEAAWDGGGGGSGGGGGGKRRAGRQESRQPRGGGGGGGGGRDARRRGGAAGERSVRVRVAGLAVERRARYLEWVAANRALVLRLAGNGGGGGGSGGGGGGALRLSYVHMEDFEELGFADFSRGFLHNWGVDHEALILDLRGNCGGSHSHLVVQRLTQRRIATDVPTHGRPSRFPEDAAPPVLVVIIDEGSSSDAEVAAYSLRRAAQATLVGARTWGGVFGCGETTLVDGTSVTHPAYAMHVHGEGWAIENQGVEPDVTVAVAPHDAAAGRDPQLAAAVEVAARRVREQRASDLREEEIERERAAPLPRHQPHWSRR